MCRGCNCPSNYCKEKRYNMSVSAFLLICSLNGAMDKQGIYFRSAVSCMDFKRILSKQSYRRNDEDIVYECICKLVPRVNPKKVKVY